MKWAWTISAATPKSAHVIISGGDSVLMLTDRKIDPSSVAASAHPEHLEIIRSSVRAFPLPCHNAITPELCAILKQYHPFYINTHFNQTTLKLRQKPRKRVACWLMPVSPWAIRRVLLRGCQRKHIRSRGHG